MLDTCTLYVTAKANHMLGFIQRNCARIINKDGLKLLYISLVHSHFCHCSQVWAPQTSMLMMEVEKVQRCVHTLLARTMNYLTKTDLLALTYYLL